MDRNCLFWGHRIIIPKIVKKINDNHKTRQQPTTREDNNHDKSHFGGNRMIDIAKSYLW